MTKPPGFADYFRVIGGSTLPATDKAVCNAILYFRSATDGTCYPSVGTLASIASLTSRTVGKALKRLAKIGVVEFVKRSRGGIGERGRGIPHTLRLDYAALRSLNREPDSGLGEASKGEPRDPQPRTSRPPTANETPPKGEPRSYKPSIHPTSETTKEPSDGAKHFSPTGWMNGARNTNLPPAGSEDERRRLAVCQALRACGVQGPNLLRLTLSPQVTIEMVNEERDRIARDKGVRNQAAVLVKALAKRLNLALPSRPTPPPRTLPRAGDTLASIERLRQHHAARRQSTQSIAEAIDRSGFGPLNP
jgi:hypothetical protein